MQKEFFSPAEIRKIFRLEDKVKSMQTLFNAEERGDIPKAERFARGSNHQARQWKISQLPEIGKKYGFLQKPNKQWVICVYTAKGGVLKTTITYALARILALNGIKVLIIGLDFQGSLTELALPNRIPESLSEVIEPTLGLHSVFYDRVPIEEVIQVTNLPTLHIIPETPELIILEKRMRAENKRELVFKEKLIPKLKDYDVIMFDNSPNWTGLIENALVASKVVISPLGCDYGTFRVLDNNLNTLRDFQTTMNVEWDHFVMIPTLLDNTTLSQQIYSSYVTNYQKDVIPAPIRRSVKGQESLVTNQSPIEYDPASSLSQDYFEFVTKFWKLLNPS